METINFEDTSIFQGVREFDTPSGKFKATEGHLYKLEGGSWIHCLTYRTDKTHSMQTLYKLWLNN